MLARRTPAAHDGAITVVGAVTSGLALPFSGPQGSGRMATAACAGTWAITPAVLKGQEPVRFVGGTRQR